MNVLHIEADEMLQQPVKGIFEPEGHRVKVAKNYAIACAEIDSSTHYDLILLGTLSRAGLYNPQFAPKELDLIKRARGLPHRLATPIIISASTNWIEDALTAGATDFFPPPADAADMKGTVAKHVHSTRV